MAKQTVYGKRLQEVTISNQDSTSRLRRRRLLSNWVKVSIIGRSRILPEKTKSNCSLATISFCTASKQQRKAIKTSRGGILLCDQSLTRKDIKENALSRNLGIFFDCLTFVVTQITRRSQVRTLITKTQNSLLQNF